MRRGIPTIVFLLAITAAFALWAWSLAGASASPQAQNSPVAARTVPTEGWGPLRVMTANVRMSSKADGDNDWPNRRELVVKQFLKYQPDLILCQEVTPSQGAYLNKELAQWYGYYPRAGVGRPAAATGRGGNVAASGGARGELMGVLNQSLASLVTVYYRTDRFEIVDGEAGLIFPEELQAVPSENAYVSIAVLKEKGTNAMWIAIDTHLRHSPIFASRCAARIREKAGEWLGQYPGAGVVVGGDMNHDRTTKVYAAFTGAAEGVDLPRFVDAFDYGQKKGLEAWGTWHPYNGLVNSAWPTDLILFAGEGVVASRPAAILREKGPNGRWPSDHFFVVAEIDRKR